jgi:hypothetical protein
MNLEEEMGRAWTLYQSGVPLFNERGRLAVDAPLAIEPTPAPGLMTPEAMALGDAPAPTFGNEFARGTMRAIGGGLRDTAQGVIGVGADLIDNQAAMDGRPTFAREATKDLLPKFDPESMAEGLARVGVNVVSALMLTRTLGMKGGVVGNVASGAVVDMLMDPEEGNLATLAREFGFENELTQFLDNKVAEDAGPEERLRARLLGVMEGAGIGGLIEGVVRGFRVIKDNPETAAKVAGALGVGAILAPEEAEGGVLSKVLRQGKGTITKLAKEEGETAAQFVERMNREAPIVSTADEFRQLYGDLPATSPEVASPAVALRATPARDFTPALPTGELGDKTTAASSFAQVGGYFDSLVRMKNGGEPRAWSNADHQRQILDEAASEVKYQLTLGDPAKRDFTKKTGWGWYDEDIRRTFDTAGQVLPELRMEAKRGVRIPWGDAAESVTPRQARILAAAVGAPQSFGNPALRNADIKFQAYEVFRKTGQFPEKGIFLDDAGQVASTGKFWTQRAVSEQYIGVLNTLIRDIGPAKAADWLVSEHTVAELRDLKRRATNAAGEPIFKGDSSMGITGRADEMRPGAFVFGPKGGQFMGNLLGFPGTTTDMWFSRTWNRYLGKSREGAGALSETGLVEQPRNLVERREMATFSRQLTDELNQDQALIQRLGRPLTERDTQAILWYFEQNLYNDLGIRVTPTSFGEGAAAYAKRAKEQGGTGIQRRPGDGSAGGANAVDATTGGP